MPIESGEDAEISNIELWRNFYRAWKRLHRGAGENLEKVGISFLDYRILRYLTEAGQVPMARLADFLMVTQGHITGVIDVLESRGLVMRNRSSDDRRVINIELTEHGVAVEMEARKLHEEYMDTVFGTLNPEEKSGLNHTLARIYNFLEGSTA